MNDIATAVGIGASALYRHFRGKSDLLVAVLDQALGQLEAAARGEPTDLPASLAEVSMQQRDYAALWDRELGALPEAAGAVLEARRRVVLDRLARAAALLGAPDGLAPLRARAALAVLESPGQHHVDLPDGAGARLVASAAEACLRAPLPRPTSGETDDLREHAGLLPHARSEALLATAGRLFAHRGYPGVSLQEIGEAVGIAGPSIYKHFPSKLDLLAAILSRGNEALWFSLHKALADATDARNALDRLVDSYLAVLAGPGGAVSVLLTEVANLPDPARSDFRASQQRYVEEWVALLMRWRGELGEPAARMLVHATFALINNLARRDPREVGDLRNASASQIGALSRAVLGLCPTRLAA